MNHAIKPKARTASSPSNKWKLAAELSRLVRLVEAPTSLIYRSGWSPWEVRYWALVITLARIGQRYVVLARQPGSDPAQRLLASAEVGWQQAMTADPLAA